MDLRDPASIPLPTTDEQFEQLCLLIARDKYGPEYYRYGRKGQAQYGIDIYSAYFNGRCLQCKLHKKEISDTKLINELRSDLAKAKQKFPDLNQFIFAVSVESRPAIQDVCKELSSQNLIVVSWFWNQMQEDIARSKWLLRNYLNSVPGAQWISNDFIQKELTKGANAQWQPISFYSANSHVQWYGILNNWDAKRKYHKDILQRINHTFADRFADMPVAAIIRGEGGSGKSVLLRRIAVDLRNDYTVYWIADNAEDFLKNEWEYDIENNPDEKYLLILEDWYRNFSKTDDRITANKLIQRVKSKTNVRMLIGDRPATQVYYPKSNKYTYDLMPEENASLFSYITDINLEWREKFPEEEKAQLLKTGLFQLLFVYQYADSSISLRKATNYFLEIIQSDYNHLCEGSNSFYNGLALALYIYANLYTDYSLRLSPEAIIILAEKYSGVQRPLDLIQNSDNLINVPTVKRYFDLIYKKSGTTKTTRLRFLHDTLADEGWKNIEVDVHRKFRYEDLIFELLETFKNEKLAVELSALVNSIETTKLTSISNEQIISTFDFLIKSQTDSPLYVQLLFSERIKMSIDDKLKYVYKFIGLGNKIDSIWSIIIQWFKNNLPDQTQLELLKKIIAANNTCSSVLIHYYKFLDDIELKNSIKQYFTVSNLLNPEYQNIALEVLKRLFYDNEILDIIRDYLKSANSHRNIVLFNNSLKLLQKEDVAINTAKNYLQSTEHSFNPDGFSACMSVLKNESWVKILAKEYLSKPNPDKHRQAYCICLYILKDEEIAKKIARNFISSFKHHYYDNAWTLSLYILDKDGIDIIREIFSASITRYDSQIIYRALMIASKIKELNELSDKYIQRIIDENHKSPRSSKIEYTYKQVMKIPLFHLNAWAKEVDKLLGDFRFINRNLFNSLILSHLDKPNAVAEACLYFIRNWEHEFNRPKKYWGYFAQSLAHPILQEQPNLRKEIRTLCTKMLLSGNCPEKLIPLVNNISKENNFPKWLEIEE